MYESQSTAARSRQADRYQFTTQRVNATAVFALLGALSMSLMAIRAQAQAPGLLWTTNIGARVFAVDAQTNVYANVGGTVITLSGAGVPLQTNAICPRPGIARRDDAGNFYFGGNFDGAQDFGGITLVGGWTNWPSPGNWTPGYPTCFLAKYSSNGILQRVTSFGEQAVSNYLTDILIDASGSAYVGYVKRNINSEGTLARVNNSGIVQWEGTAPAYYFSFAVTLGGLTSSNCCFFNFRYDGLNQAEVGRVDSSGNHYLLGAYPLRWRSDAASNGKPVIDDLGQTLAVGRCFDPITNPGCSAQVLRKYGAGTSIIWDREVTPEAHWTLARDPQANVYLAGTNGMLAKYDSDGFLVWSNNFSQPPVSMAVDTSGNRFVSFADGHVARLAADLPSQAPSILNGPQPLTVFVGDPVSLSVTAVGTLPLKYFWRLGGTTVASATNNPFYSFSNATPSQAGLYTVIVSNVAGSVTSAPALLRVKSVQLYYGSQLLTNGTYVFASPPTLNIRSAFASGPSFYTLDGSAPDFNSTYYSSPFTVSQSATVRALGYSADFSQSEEADAVSVVVLARHNLSVSTSGGGFISTNSNPSPAEVNCVTPPSGAAAWWRAENNITDPVGGHTGTIIGNMTFSNGIVGQAFHFDGDLSNERIRVADAPGLRFTSEMTLEVWVKPEENQVMGQGGGTIASRWDAVQARTQSSYRLRLGNQGLAYFAISPNGAGGGTSGNIQPFCSTATAIPLGVWTHLACTYDGNALRIYVNGVLEGQTAWTGSIFPGSDDLGIAATVGGAAPDSGSDHYRGLIDELTLYNRALSSAEVQGIYQAGVNGKCTSPPFKGGSYLETDTVALTALPFAGNAFLYWLGDAAATNPTITVSMERDKAVHAVFGTTLATTVTGNGQVQRSPEGGTYAYGTEVRLTAIPNPGNYFGFWGNAATGNTNPLYFKVSAPTQTVSSIFGPLAADQAALTVLINGRGQVNVSPRANAYSTNQSVTLTALPDSGQSFLNWSGDAGGTQNPLSVAMTQSKVITANFTSRPFLRVNRPGVEGFTSAGFRFTLVSDAPSAYQIFGSTNLTTWEGLGSVTNTLGEAQFTDTNAPGFRSRFYRAAP